MGTQRGDGPREWQLGALGTQGMRSPGNGDLGTWEGDLGSSNCKRWDPRGHRGPWGDPKMSPECRTAGVDSPLGSRGRRLRGEGQGLGTRGDTRATILGVQEWDLGGEDTEGTEGRGGNVDGVVDLGM